MKISDGNSEEFEGKRAIDGMDASCSEWDCIRTWCDGKHHIYGSDVERRYPSHDARLPNQLIWAGILVAVVATIAYISIFG